MSCNWRNTDAELHNTDGHAHCRQTSTLMKCTTLLQISALLQHFLFKERLRKHQIPSDRRAIVRIRSKLQNKIEKATNHQNWDNVLNQNEVIKNNLKLSIKETCIRTLYTKSRCMQNVRYFNKFENMISNIKAGIWTLPGERGHVIVQQKYRRITKINDQYNSIFNSNLI